MSTDEIETGVAVNYHGSLTDQHGSGYTVIDICTCSACLRAETLALSLGRRLPPVRWVIARPGQDHGLRCVGHTSLTRSDTAGPDVR